MKRTFLTLCIILVAVACKKDDETNPLIGSNFIGKWQYVNTSTDIKTLDEALTLRLADSLVNELKVKGDIEFKNAIDYGYYNTAQKEWIWGRYHYDSIFKMSYANLSGEYIIRDSAIFKRDGEKLIRTNDMTKLFKSKYSKLKVEKVKQIIEYKK